METVSSGAGFEFKSCPEKERHTGNAYNASSLPES
jgi:hypothetical protein